MTTPRMPRRAAVIGFVLPLASCGLISETGPLKGKITQETEDYVLVEVNSSADFPSSGRTYGKAEIPPVTTGRGYSDLVRPRDSIEFSIVDLTEQSPFYTPGGAYKYGPLEVPADGRIEIPYVGELLVLDRSLAQLSSELNEKIKPVSNTARATITRSGRLLKNASVLGEVKNPGLIPLDRSGITSLDLLAASGGPNRADHLFNYSVRRGNREYAFDYVGFRRNPFLIEEGDLLTVSPDNSNRFHVMGAINRPVSVSFPVPSPTLADAMGAATGLDERRSDPSGIFVFRKGNPSTVYTFNLKDPKILTLSQRFPILGEDIIYVTEAPLTRWNRMLTQILPLTVSQAANSAYRYGQ